SSGECYAGRLARNPEISPEGVRPESVRSGHRRCREGHAGTWEGEARRHLAAKSCSVVPAGKRRTGTWRSPHRPAQWLEAEGLAVGWFPPRRERSEEYAVVCCRGG